MRPTFVLLFVAAALVVAVNAQDRRLLAPSTCSATTGLKGSDTAYKILLASDINGTICFNITTNNACDSTKACCTSGAAKPPKFKSLLLTPPAGSSCASKKLSKLIKWTVGTAKPKAGKTDGAVMTVNIATLDPTNGGLVCVDLSATKDANCQAYENLCKSGGSCGIALQTGKYKKAQGGPAADCCSAAYEQTPPTDCTDTPPGTACGSGGDERACLVDQCDPKAVIDCSKATGLVRCSAVGIPYGFCCTPDQIGDLCTEAQAGTCVVPQGFVDTSKGESCKGTADLQVLCETPEYLSICQGGSCDKPVADCAGAGNNTPCQYGDAKIIGYCSANECVKLSV